MSGNAYRAAAIINPEDLAERVFQLEEKLIRVTDSLAKSANPVAPAAPVFVAVLDAIHSRSSALLANTSDETAKQWIRFAHAQMHEAILTKQKEFTHA